jgi:hypothetical protein
VAGWAGEEGSGLLYLRIRAIGEDAMVRGDPSWMGQGVKAAGLRRKSCGDDVRRGKGLSEVIGFGRPNWDET